ncbi:MAG: glycerol-3-phosphate 1-O-acyltransferase PlsY [Clostridia bacterium]|nr:glycerol-3-phosphate 1-O-acyltransferase PlsY [Clostridia bacterium]
MSILKYIAIAIIGYLLGNISGGLLIARCFGVSDIRKHGSGNSGTTNVLRTVGWLPSVLTLVCDCLKGYVACLIGKALGGDLGMVLGGFCAVLGHDFPVFMGFKGGKGIATSLALIIAINPWLALAELLTEIVVVALTRYMSVASLITAVAFPVFTAILCRGHKSYGIFVLFSCMAAALALFQHRGNIQRLLRGEENRLDFAKITKISEKVMARKRGKRE